MRTDMNENSKAFLGVADKPAELTNAYLRGVYAWMAAGLMVTAIAAWGVINEPVLWDIATRFRFLFVIALLIMAFTIGGAINRLSASMATVLFLAYSMLFGVVLSFELSMYTSASIMQTFITSSGMFVAMSLYGLMTKRDLTSLGSFCMMGLFGILIAIIINLIWPSGMLNFIICCVGVLVFLGLTAYDTQRLRAFGATAPEDDAVALRRGTIMGALTLYLDFINLFMMLLRLTGDRR